MQSTAVNGNFAVAATQIMFDASMAALTSSGDMHDLNILFRDEPQRLAVIYQAHAHVYACTADLCYGDHNGYCDPITIFGEGKGL